MKIRKIIAIAVVVGVIGTIGTVYASTIRTPAEVAAGLTGKTVNEVSLQRSQGKTYGTIAKDAGKLDEFKTQMLEQRKSALQQRVEDGTITQEQADTIYNNIKTNQLTCDGTGSARIGRQGAGQGCSMGNSGAGNGNGQGCLSR